MTLFEYLAGAYVLMLSLALLRAMAGVPHAVRAARRYWLHATWLVFALATCLVAFWAFWSYRDVDWTIFRFMNSLAVPALLYCFIALLVPPDPSAVTSWQDHFFDIRARLFATGVALMVAVIVSNQFTLQVPALHPSQLGNYALLTIYFIAFISARPAVHGVVAVVFAVIVAATFSTLLVQPDSLFRPVR